MRKLIITVVVLFVILTMNAQKCKPKFIHKDDFTGVKTELWGGMLTSMSVYSLNVKYIPTMYVFKQKDEYKIVIGINVDGRLDNSMVLNNHSWFERGSKIRLKLENELLEFIVEKGEVRQAGGTSAEITSTITIEQIEKLKSKRILLGGVYPFKNNEDMIFKFKVSKGSDKKIKKQITCFLLTEKKK